MPNDIENFDRSQDYWIPRSTISIINPIDFGMPTRCNIARINMKHDISLSYIVEIKFIP